MFRDLRFGWVRAVAVILGVVLSGTSAHGVTFSDSFSTNPYPSRWCERVHHAHWDSSGGLLSGTNGTSCSPSANSCTSTTPFCFQCALDGSFGLCAAGNYNGFLAITKTSYSGNNRTASAHFAMQSPAFTKDPGISAEHAAVFLAVHPHCHTGVQGMVASSSPFAGQGLFIVVGSDIKAGFPECNSYGMLGNGVGLSLSTSALPRYTLATNGSVVSGNLVVQANLYDDQTGALLGTSSLTVPKPVWYNNQAKRYGLGAIRYLNSGAVIPWDNFESNSF